MNFDWQQLVAFLATMVALSNTRLLFRNQTSAGGRSGASAHITPEPELEAFDGGLGFILKPTGKKPKAQSPSQRIFASGGLSLLLVRPRGIGDEK